MDSTEIKSLVDLRLLMQRQRVAFNNRLAAMESGRDEATDETVAKIKAWRERFAEMEDQATADLNEIADEHEMVQLLSSLHGIGKVLAAQVVSLIDIEKANTVSALWRYAGYAVIDGVRERPTKGERIHYNIRLKTVCYLVASSFLRTGSPYRKVYDDARAYYEANRPTWTKAHQHQAALRKMIKVWLQHTWIMWRQLEGLPSRGLYVHDRLGHEHYYTPEEFGWPDIAIPEGWEVEHA